MRAFATTTRVSVNALSVSLARDAAERSAPTTVVDAGNASQLRRYQLRMARTRRLLLQVMEWGRRTPIGTRRYRLVASVTMATQDPIVPF